MPVYHSSLNGFVGQGICGTMVFPLKTKVKGPAPPAKTGEEDIIDESLKNFRANVMFRNFPSKGPGDLTQAYITAFIAQVLREFSKQKTKNEAKAKITALSMSQNFAVPGEKGWQFPGFFKEPASRSESESFRNYYRQLREELVNRLVDLAYLDNGEQNKWWMQFSKRKFMNISSV